MTKNLSAPVSLLGLAATLVLACGESSSNSANTTADGGSAGSGAGGSNAAGAAGAGANAEWRCITDVTAAERHQFECDELMFDVSVPEPCLTEACGLILDVHGFSMSGKMEDNNTGLAALGREHGYIVVNPNAMPAPPAASWDSGGADDSKLYDFMQQVIAAFGVDEKRVHVTGFSQGGGMSWRFICDYSELLASAAPAALGHTTTGVNECFTNGAAPKHVVPMLYIHGTDDGLVDFADAIAARDAVISTLGLDGEEVVSSDGAHVWTRYTNSDGDLFEFIQHDYVAASTIIKGHCYPGSVDDQLEKGQFFGFGCEPPNAFHWGEEAMKFFIAHPKP